MFIPTVYIHRVTAIAAIGCGESAGVCDAMRTKFIYVLLFLGIEVVLYQLVYKLSWLVAPAPDREIVVRLRARLGNHLFQLASATGIAANHNTSMCYIMSYGASNYLQDLVPKTPFSECSMYTTLLYYTSRLYAHEEKGHCIFDMPRLHESTLSVGQYLQSYKYFENVDIASMYVVRPEHVLMAKQTMHRALPKRDKIQTVGIHIRRTDQITAGFLNIPPPEYFSQTVEYFRRTISHVHFFVVSDDMEWCMQQDFFRHKAYISLVHNSSVMADFALLVACNHVIITVGTFGWWGAFLGPHLHGGEVLYYQSEFNMNHNLNINTVVHRDYYPPSWKAILPVFSFK